MDKNDRDKIALAIAALQLMRQGVQYKREMQEAEQAAHPVISQWQDLKSHDWRGHLPDRFQPKQSHTGRNIALGGAAVGIAAAGAYLARRGKIQERVQKVRLAHPEIAHQIVPITKETVAAVKAGGQDAKQTVTQLAKDKAHEQVDVHIVAPAKQKAVKFGSIGVVALTIYIIFIATGAAALVFWLMGG